MGVFWYHRPMDAFGTTIRIPDIRSATVSVADEARDIINRQIDQALGENAMFYHPPEFTMSRDPVSQHTYVTGRAEPLTNAELHEAMRSLQRELDAIRRERWPHMQPYQQDILERFRMPSQTLTEQQFRQEILGSWVHPEPPRPAPRTLASSPYWSRE